MARRVVFLAGLMCLLTAVGPPVIAADPVVPESGFAEGWERDGARLVFVGHDLYGHINGGAELFHEFGFDSLIVQRYKHGGQELDLEIYIMTEHPSALGIYLMKVGKETPVDGVQAHNSGSASQLSLVRGRCFVQINNFYGEEALVPDMVALANATVAAIPEDKPCKLWQLLPDSGLVKGSVRLIRGQYAMQPIFTLGPGDMLLLDGRTFGVVGKYLAPVTAVDGHGVVVKYADARFAQGCVQRYPEESRSLSHAAGAVGRRPEF